jgi:LacI family transcriptional regulator
MTKHKVTIHDIARALDTTASTVSRALQDHPRISISMKKAVWDLARKLNYQPNSIASSLRKGKGNTIGVIIPRIDRYFFSSVIRGIEDVAYEAGYNILICQSYDSFEREKAIVETLINGKVDGLLVSLATGTKDIKHFQLVQSKGLPLVFFDRVPQELEVNKVEIDDFAGAFKAVDYLVSEGCQRIVHLSGPQHVSVYQNRLEGYKAALIKNGLPFNETFVFKDMITRDSGEQAAIKIRKMKVMPDGIFSASDFSALGLILKLKSFGIQIPKDIAIVGFANEPFDDMLTPGLSSIDQHSIEMGHNVAKLFLEEISNQRSNMVPRRIILNPELHVRESSMKKSVK